MGKKRSKKQIAAAQRRRKEQGRRGKTRVCRFCSDNINVDWKDTAVLRKYMSERAKIRARRVTGNCPRHQREVAVAIKNGREMALLPYIGRQ